MLADWLAGYCSTIVHVTIRVHVLSLSVHCGMFFSVGANDDDSERRAVTCAVI